MTQEERSRIISQDYADFIIDYRTNPELPEELPGASIYILNETYAIIHVPISEISGRSLSGIRIAITPRLYGLTSEISLEASGVMELRNIPN